MKIFEAIRNYKTVCAELENALALIGKLKMEREKYLGLIHEERNACNELKKDLVSEKEANEVFYQNKYLPLSKKLTEYKKEIQAIEKRADAVYDKNNKLRDDMRKIKHRAERNAKFAFHARKENRLCRRDNKVLNETIKELGDENKKLAAENSKLQKAEFAKEIRWARDEYSKRMVLMQKVWLPVNLLNYHYDNGTDMIEVRAANIANTDMRFKIVEKGEDKHEKN